MQGYVHVFVCVLVTEVVTFASFITESEIAPRFCLALNRLIGL